MARKEKTSKTMQIVEQLVGEAARVQLPMAMVLKANNKSEAIGKMNSHKTKFSGRKWVAKWVDGNTQEIIGNNQIG